jgi:hypothetical protein
VTIAIFPEDEDDVGPSIERSVSALWDAYWASFVRRPFTWQRFACWWAARRWVEPRDVRRQ